MNLETGGRLESPNYPLEYLPSKECIWKITVPKEVVLRHFNVHLKFYKTPKFVFVSVPSGSSFPII